MIDEELEDNKKEFQSLHWREKLKVNAFKSKMIVFDEIHSK